MKYIFQLFASCMCSLILGCQTPLTNQVAEVPESHVSREPEPSKPTDEEKPTEKLKLAWSGKHPDADIWTASVLDSLILHGADLLESRPVDASEFCPNFSSLNPTETRQFFAQFISIIAKHESRFNSAVFYKECSSSSQTYGAKGKYFASEGKYCIPGHKKDGGIAVSRGLLQISLESAQAYNCDLNEPEELHDPLRNISCAVRILNRFVPSERMSEGKMRGHGRLAGKVDSSWKGASAYWSVMRFKAGKESFADIKKYLSTLEICKAR